MRTIYKYPLTITDEQILTLPSDPELLDVQFQGDVLTLWALVNPDSPTTEKLRIHIIGTGAMIPGDRGDYIGTAQAPTAGPQLVWHVFASLT
jgi:hypothetical protein